MAEEKMMRLSQVARILNVGTSTIVDYLSAEGFKVESNPNTKLDASQITSLAKEYGADKLMNSGGRQKTAAEPEPEKKEVKQSNEDEVLYFRTPAAPVAEKKEEKPVEENNIPIEAKLPGIKVVGKIGPRWPQARGDSQTRPGGQGRTRGPSARGRVPQA